MQTKTAQPNIVFILSDQHNAGILGAAGDQIVRTASLDRLASDGVMLTNAYCASPLCVPSRAALLSVRLPCNNGVFNNLEALRSDRATFVHALAAAGYETVLAGRMHFNGPDQRHGYMHRLVGDITASFPGRGNRDRQFGELIGTPDQSRTSIERSGGGGSAVLQFDRAVADAACQHLATRDTNRPLFMTIGFYGPHCPYVAPEALYRKYFPEVTLPPVMGREEREGLHPAVQGWYRNRGVEIVAPEDIRRVRAAYYGMVEYLDGLIGELLDQVERTAGLDNTLIVYASDHGDNIGEHGLFWKTNFYEGAARVPLIFSMPGTLPSGTRVSTVASLLDLAPTFLSAAKAAPLPAFDGQDLWGALTAGETLDEERAIYSQLADLKGDAPSAMVRQGDWKLVVHHGYSRPQLFNLVDDPGEIKDLGETASLADVRERLLDLMAEQWNSEAAASHTLEAKRHSDVLRRFTQATNLEGFDEWYGEQSGNFISVTNV